MIEKKYIYSPDKEKRDNSSICQWMEKTKESLQGSQNMKGVLDAVVFYIHVGEK
jgi:hypothetical protein